MKLGLLTGRDLQHTRVVLEQMRDEELSATEVIKEIEQEIKSRTSRYRREKCPACKSYKWVGTRTDEGHFVMECKKCRYSELREEHK